MNQDPKASPPAGDHRRKRLRFQCWHRGIREMDLILGAFADHHLDRLPQDELAALEALLAIADTTLYLWVTGREAVPRQHDGSLFQRLKAFAASHPHG